MVLTRALLVLAIFGFGLVASQTADINLPRKDALIGLWPLNAYYKFRDISGNKLDGTAITGAADSIQHGQVDNGPGPFGDSQSAYTNAATDKPRGIFKRQNNRLAGEYVTLNSSFTISFFVKASSAYYNSITYYDVLHFYNDKDTTSNKQFGINYILQAGNVGMIGYLQRIGFDTALSKVAIDPEIWNFHAITFNASSCMLTTYNRFGLYQTPQYEPNICKSLAYNTNGFWLGRRIVTNSSVPSGYFHSAMSVSCLAMFNDQLNGDEVMSIYDSCRAILSAEPCGVPRIPGVSFPAPLPPSTMRRGQFPYLAVLRYKTNLQCSAVILNGWWLLTSASCIIPKTNTYDYNVGVGLYDLATATTTHYISRIITHESFANNSGRYENDIAIIELSTSIDFGSPYVSDVCLPWSWYREHSIVETSLYFAGWGINGRPSLVSDTAHRYTAGSKMPTSFCTSNWGSSTFKSDKMLCYLSDYDTSVPCDGDEGGPLTLVSETSYAKRGFLAGLYSFRDDDCKSTTKPPVFTNIEPYLPWIHSKVACAIPSRRVLPTTCPLTK